MIHVASPFDMKMGEKEIIRKAVDGTNSILNSCLANRVKKLVITSSTAAIVPVHIPKLCYDESDFVDPDFELNSPYTKSKILASNLVFNFSESLPEDSGLDIVMISPSLIVGN